jgi:hypothetical protein
MATTRKAEDPGTGTEESGFNETQRTELQQIIAEAVAGVKPPAAPSEPSVPAMTDDQWDGMSDRQREGFVRSIVDNELDRLSQLDTLRAHDEQIRALAEKNQTVEPEAHPDPMTRVRKFLWGSEK